MNKIVLVREETDRDQTAVFKVNEEAFARPDEARLVQALNHAAAVTLSLVAEEDGRVVAHALFSPMTLVEDGTGRRHHVVGLGPVAVLPERQRQGLGMALIEDGLARCRVAGHTAVFVLGHPTYYPRFGFQPTTQFGIRCGYDVPEDAFMALELQPGALQGVTGVAYYHPAFDGV